MSGKNGAITEAVLVTGVASQRSLAAAITHQLLANKTNVIITVAGDRERQRAEALASTLNSKPGTVLAIISCDVSKENDITELAHYLSDHDITISGFVHAIGNAAIRDDNGNAQGLLNSSPTEQQRSLDISSWSLPRLLAAVQPQLAAGASVVALTYHGARRAVPGYNIMGVAKAALEACVRYLALELGSKGIRVNAISAGSIRTPAAQAVPGFAKRLALAVEKSPLGRTVSAEEVAATAAFLLSPGASGITGQIITCDCGVGIVG